MLFTFSLVSALLATIITPVTAIINGKNGTLDNYEYTVAIMMPSLVGSETPYICDGILITEQTILTAAECMAGLEPSDIEIRIGFPGTEQYVCVNNITTMKTFNYTTLAGDVSLLNLTMPVTNVTPAVLATSTIDGAYPSGEVKIIGWGATTNNTEAIASRIHIGTVDVIRYQTCAAALSTCGFKLNRNTRFCTSSNANGAEGYGDAGGPVVDSEGIVVGLMTGSPSCAQPDSLALQLLVSAPRVAKFIAHNSYGLP